MTNNEMKLHILDEMIVLQNDLACKISVLRALDTDSSTSGAGDLIDQIETMDATIVKMGLATHRAICIVPGGE